MNKTLLAVVLAFFSLSSVANTGTQQAVASEQTFPKNALVLQTDFSLKDGAVSAMQGVAFGVDRDLKMFNLTHEIPAYNIWEAAYRLYQTATYWPQGTVFVSVVDPGVGTDRKSVVLKTKTGHYFVTPDNGTLTLVAEHLGIESVRQIDEQTNRLEGSEKSYTFHGRDVYAYTGARLASGKIRFEEVGQELEPKVVEIAYQRPTLEDGVLKGNIPVLDIQYGNIWTNISDTLLEQSGIKKDGRVCVEISEKIGEEVKVRYSGAMPYKSSFGDVETGRPLMYLNSLLNISFALNMDSFADKYKIKSGAEWSVSLKSCEKKTAE
ncbi:S-adenosyl-l-methionine hydroxide adenosyltransferase family protein [Ursidibacter maritimus]|uniref:S-adenosyl-l-methionine hydroxide adenosyltransferase family protein n=1 Tax=Ursidibacter maritimus TaxID=1331689 RepID=A0A949T3L3_9PAST|nr:S-adenosyl-l-methionine hydroxide adenosyltransferase family protein [Ursidibacter maritimus]KAE9540312.1 DNA-directed RNA polymerase subunit delta [Ursidibacter maritimus]MBV6524497.1 S-adenosyl-l-methionine hydroxide adenosyltransferase family protein [Ursidibacter maritimus]MBV6525325.1 S-adenosyl-l-methionine hydroxide adenosyltransferase family protein [Ursidibacter maritimus]MBV6528006.1 S-adenosyl-l-methionine hydroxide adenosyltransferase family protein [Ursidibacter maritimus]MBV65